MGYIKKLFQIRKLLQTCFDEHYLHQNFCILIKLEHLCIVNIPFSSGALLYFSNLLTAMASKRTLAAGYSFKTSHMSFLLNTNKSLYPTDLTLAVLRFPTKTQNTTNKNKIAHRQCCCFCEIGRDNRGHALYCLV